MVHHDGVAVDVGDAGPRVGRARYLVRGGRGWEPGAEVDELVDALLRHVGNRAGQEALVLLHDMADARDKAGQLFRQVTVGREVVTAAEQEVVHPRRVGHGRVETSHAIILMTRHGSISENSGR